MKKDKIIFLDVDGTIFDNKKGVIHQSTIEGIKAIHDKGEALIFIATGRAPNMLEHLNIIKPYISGYVLLNGQYVIHQEEVVYNTPIDSNGIKQLQEFAKSENIPLGVVGLKNANVTFIDINVEASFRDYQIKPFSLGPFGFDFLVYQAWFFGNEELINKARKKIPDFKFLNWGTRGCDIIIKNTSKAVGVELLIKKFEIDHEQTYAFGDANNDIEMIQKVRHSVAMGNATSELKLASSHITKNIDEDGLYEAFKHFKLI